MEFKSLSDIVKMLGSRNIDLLKVGMPSAQSARLSRLPLPTSSCIGSSTAHPGPGPCLPPTAPPWCPILEGCLLTCDIFPCSLM